jgi:hypothetical protein
MSLLFPRAFAFVALASLLSCAKKDEPATPVPASASSMSWTVDGAAVTSSSNPTTVDTHHNLAYCEASATVNGAAAGLDLNIPLQAGTYNLANATTANTAQAMYYLADSGRDYKVTSGSLVVTSYRPSGTAGESNLVGTFAFNCAAVANSSDTKAITKGSFNLKY